MNLSKRHREILALAKEKGFLATAELTDHFKVTPQTIRRDINELCDKGLLKRYHGGAGAESSIQNLNYETRQILNRQAKERMARLAADQIPDGVSLFINIGTSTEEVAKALCNHKSLRVITNNLNVAMLLCNKEDFEVIITGGVVRADWGVTGESTIDFVRQFKVDYGIIGISGIDEDGALLDYDYREVRVAQAIIENARNIFLMADHSKFSRTPMVRLGHLKDIDALFTDQSPSKRIIEQLNTENVELYVTDPVE